MSRNWNPPARRAPPEWLARRKRACGYSINHEARSGSCRLKFPNQRRIFRPCRDDPLRHLPAFLRHNEMDFGVAPDIAEYGKACRIGMDGRHGEIEGIAGVRRDCGDKDILQGLPVRPGDSHAGGETAFQDKIEVQFAVLCRKPGHSERRITLGPNTDPDITALGISIKFVVLRIGHAQPSAAPSAHPG